MVFFKFCGISFVVCCLYCTVVLCPLSGAEALQPGDNVPFIYLKRPSEPAAQIYLGLVTEPAGSFKREAFTISDIKAELIVIEFLNRYCPSCQAQVPVMNAIYSLIENNPLLKSRVKVVGIGVGNNEEELIEFKAEQLIAFPLIPDPEFIAYDAIGDPGGTPYTVLVRKVDNQGVILSTHLGRINSAEDLLKDIQDALSLDVDSLHTLIKKKSVRHSEKRVLNLTLSENEILENIRHCLQNGIRSFVHRNAINITKISLPGNKTVFKATLPGNGTLETLYATVISRNPTCDVCHGIHFIVAFNRMGVIKNFSALHLTKYGNALWTAADVRFMQKRLIGQSLMNHMQFNSKIDAVSMATMTSAIIFNSLNKLRETVKELQRLEKDVM